MLIASLNAWGGAMTPGPPAATTAAVVHLHGLRDRRGKADTPDRRAQAERIVRLVAAVREPDDLVVVCGDLNLLPDSRTFALLAAIGLVDLVGTADTRTPRYAKPVRHASYLLVSDPAAVRRFEILTEPRCPTTARCSSRSDAAVRSGP